MSIPFARDLMTPDVVTVPPETPVLAIAHLLAERGISAVPVLAPDGALLGIVTEADLIRRLAGAEDKPAGWFARLFANEALQAERYARTHGTTAAEIMTEAVASVEPETPATVVAAMMEERGIRRVVVVRDGKLAGIVSRADLLRALVAPSEAMDDISDDRLRRAVLARMRNEPWADTYYCLVEVKGGIVNFHGFSRSAAVQRGLKVLAEGVPGVKGVTDQTQPMPVFLYGAA